jgi:hypothetical protein
MTPTVHRALILAMTVAVAACQAAAPPSTVIPLTTLNQSSVTGTVTLIDVGEGRTQVDIRVDPGANRDMPAHIHPGSCANPVPQPKYPLVNVVDGVSTTVVRATVTELTAGDLMVNLHKSNDDLRTYTACADL